METLIFIDTNILLDFYRIRSTHNSMPFLQTIDANLDKIICTNQVEMEFKKNRQKVILESLQRIKIPDWNGLTSPAFLAEAQPTLILRKNKSEMTTQIRKLRRRAEQAMKEPTSNDAVYKSLQKLFRKQDSLNLTRTEKVRFQIRRLAWKRFMLGYPPRKDEDCKIGDAINWEWLIHCAIKNNCNITIVSRDSDYGVSYNNELFMNDWLMQEFKERVSKRRKLILTDKLSIAFKMSGIKVSKEDESAEKTLITATISDSPTESYLRLFGNVDELKRYQFKIPKWEWIMGDLAGKTNKMSND